MYRIRFHARGGQGIKTASRILGTALFLSGLEVQDAPRYGAERRGAPIFAYVRADRKTINERGIILRPDLIVVSDDSLMAMAGAGVAAGADRDTVFLLFSEKPADFWQKEVPLAARSVLLKPPPEEEQRFIGAACAGAAARLLGMVDAATLAEAVTRELTPLGAATVAANLDLALRAHQAMADQSGMVREAKEHPVTASAMPHWIELAAEEVPLSAPVILAGITSGIVQTGLWRSKRPVIDPARCRRCWWICSTFCPDGAIQVDEEKRPIIDYQHCKGCMICMTQCPARAITARSEGEETEGGADR